MTPERFTYKLRQGPGAGNALGHIKFMFPNQFNIYLHDTPARGLFARERARLQPRLHPRAKSRDPRPPSSWTSQPGWPLEAIEAAIATGKRQIITLKEPLPVHIAYLTAWVNKDGSVNFRRRRLRPRRDPRRRPARPGGLRKSATILRMAGTSACERPSSRYRRQPVRRAEASLASAGCRQDRRGETSHAEEHACDVRPSGQPVSRGRPGDRLRRAE